MDRIKTARYSAIFVISLYLCMAIFLSPDLSTAFTKILIYAIGFFFTTSLISFFTNFKSFSALFKTFIRIKALKPFIIIEDSYSGVLSNRLITAYTLSNSEDMIYIQVLPDKGNFKYYLPKYKDIGRFHHFNLEHLMLIAIRNKIKTPLLGSKNYTAQEASDILNRALKVDKRKKIINDLLS